MLDNEPNHEGIVPTIPTALLEPIPAIQRPFSGITLDGKTTEAIDVVMILMEVFSKMMMTVVVVDHRVSTLVLMATTMFGEQEHYLVEATIKHN